jgi:alkanesulfonate monooxygenase SsuD/methylene tetrahydromethanopterin reductase-like flavin-dependent oxidoreductase (luciferase family)
MSACSNELRMLGAAYPRTCARCGFGPCRKEYTATRNNEVADLAAKIASNVFPHHLDQQHRDSLAALLAAFAAEIKRSAIEP